MLVLTIFTILVTSIIIAREDKGLIFNEGYCNDPNYQTQSPRAIETSKALDSSQIGCSPRLGWNVHKLQQFNTWTAENTGHTIKLSPEPTPNNKFSISVLPNQFAVNDDDNQEFCFDSLHFHWGSKDNYGSEHVFNGKRQEMEIHFVHYSCDYNNINAALEPSNYNNPQQLDDDYTLAVVGVMADAGSTTNVAFQKIIDQIELLRYPENEDILGKPTGKAIINNFNINELIPLNKEFYYYEGSLTTPDCNPIVRWHLLKDSIIISKEQLNILRTLMGIHGENESNNYRHLQNNINPVYECTLENGIMNSDSNDDDSDSDSDSDEDDSSVVPVLYIKGVISGVIGGVLVMIIGMIIMAIFYGNIIRALNYNGKEYKTVDISEV